MPTDAPGQVEIAGILVLVDVQCESTGPKLGVQIVGWRERPTLIRKEESMVARFMIQASALEHAASV